jgi:hypothetical protein
VVAGKVAAAKASNSKRKGAGGDNYFEDPSLPGSTAGVPSGVGASAAGLGPYHAAGTSATKRGLLNAGAAGRAGPYSTDDRRLYLASPEEILRFRAAVEYLLPEDVRVEDFRRCFEDGRFRTSVCPLPLPTMQQMASPRPGDLNRESSG